MPRILTVALIAAAAVPVAATAQKPLALTRPDAEFAEPFSSISGIRELRDGRVLVADARDRIVQLVDFRSGVAVKVGREGSGPGEYALPVRLFPLPGDSSAVFDVGNQRYLVIHPDGKTGRDFRLEAAGSSRGDAGGRGGGGRMMTVTVPAGVDARGNIYYEGQPFTLSPDGQMVQADSVAVLRFDRAARRVDTVAFRRVARANATISGGRGDVSVRVGGGNPLAPADAWGALPDGRVAVARVADYHLDVFTSPSRKVSGAPVPFEKIAVDAAVRKMIEDQRARNARNAVRMMVTNDNGAVSRSTEVGGRGAADLPPLTDWPEVMPPFQSVTVRPNGEVWVLRYQRPGIATALYDVFDATGRVIGHVTFPPRTRLIGFGQGTVYLIRTDDDDLQYLQRYRLAMDAKLAG